MAHKFEVGVKGKLTDSFGNSTLKSIHHNLGIKSLNSARVLKVFTIDKQLSTEQIERVRKELLNDPLVEHSSINHPLSFDFDFAIEVGFLPGVKDNQGDTAREAIEDLLAIKFAESEKVYTANLFLLKGKLSPLEVEKIASSLFNPLIQTAFTKSIQEFKKENGMNTPLPIVKISEKPRVDEVSLQVSDEELVKIGKEGIQDPITKASRGPLALGLEEMKAIKKYFEKQGRNPKDIELEALAQTWSEHCKHTIFAAEIDEIREGLFNHYIKRLTEQVRKNLKDDWLVSVFSDNSGVIKFNEDWNVCFKVETHNSPSALDPYGGAITGIVGVNRDPLGTGNGTARLILNMYGFCFGNPYYEKELPYRGKNKQSQILHPRVVFEGVRKGVEHGGNKSGIPTPHGFLIFDDRFMGKPLVFVGTVGLMHARLNGKNTALKEAKVGDFIIMAGNRVGKDGIHGATFSSESLHSGSPMGAVQIGDPITQKKLADAQFEAAMLELFNSVTDNGAGGLSCSIAEMAKESGGCEVELEKVPLKYPNLPPNEVWISESQERMTYAVPEEKLERFFEIMRKHGAEATIIGKFTDSGKCVVKFHDETILDLDMEFLHEGVPSKKLQTTFTGSLYKHPTPEFPMPESLNELLKEMLSRLNVCSKEFVARQFDHEVQGLTVIKPMQGIKQNIHSNAGVIKPLYESNEGLAISTGIFSHYSDIDTYWMAACAVDTAFRNLIAVGANIERIAVLDNFCWCSSNEPERLGQLKRAAKAFYDTGLAYNAPAISGKDSMFNDFKGFDAAGNPVKISVPPTLLATSIGKVESVGKCVSIAPKFEGDLVYALGTTMPELGCSEYYASKGFIGNTVPKVNTGKAFKLYKKLAEAIQKNLIASCISPSHAGLGAALAKKAIAGQKGMLIELSKIPRQNVDRNDFLLFSESQSRFIATVNPARKREFEELMQGTEFAQVGTVAGDGENLVIKGLQGNEVVNVSLQDLEKAYKQTLDW